MKYQIISLKQFFPVKGAIYYVAIAKVIFSHVKITMLFSHVKISSSRAKAHLVFHWCLCNKMDYLMCAWLAAQTVKPHNILTDNAMIYMSLNTPDHGPLFAVIQ